MLFLYDKGLELRKIGNGNGYGLFSIQFYPGRK